MAQIAPVATLVGTGLSLYSTARQAKSQQSNFQAQTEQANAQEQARLQTAAVQGAASARARQDLLTRTVASTRARMAASGISPNEGSAAAVTEGLRQDATQDEEEDASLSAARLSAGHRSLLNSDGSLTTWLRAGTSFAGAARSLLD